MKKLFTTILLAMMAVTTWAYDVEVDGIYYNLVKSMAFVTYKTTDYNSYSGDVTIPETIIYGEKTYYVTRIGESAFRSCSYLTSVNIPKTITNIEDHAFWFCSSLTSITFPDSVIGIGDYAFTHCTGLVSINIPNSVTNIGESAFWQCSGLNSLTISNSVTEIDEWTFAGCTGLSSVNIPNSVTKIGQGAFNSCTALKSIIIPNNVTVIDDYAFKNCTSMTSVIIGNSVKSIWSNAFSSCKNLENVICYAEQVPKLGFDVFNDSYVEYITLNVPATSVDLYKAADQWKEFGTIKSIDEASALNYSYDTENQTATVVSKEDKYKGYIVIPETITKDGETYTVTNIGQSAFYNCTELTGVTIPSTVTTIGDKATLNEGAFAGCTGLKSITIPNSVTSLGEQAFAYCSNLEIAVIGDGVTKLPMGLFYECKKLTSVILGNAVEYIGGYGDWEAPNVFGGCESLQTIDIPNTVKVIGKMAFSGCSKLESIIIPENVTTLEAMTFKECTSLSKITLPSSISYISSGTFYGCSKINEFTCYSSTVPDLGNDAFIQSSISTATLKVPAKSVELYKAADQWKEFGTIMAIDDTGINAVEGVKDNSKHSVYNLSGVKANGDSKGILIIDGKKVLKR